MVGERRQQHLARLGFDSAIRDGHEAVIGFEFHGSRPAKKSRARCTA